MNENIKLILKHTPFKTLKKQTNPNKKYCIIFVGQTTCDLSETCIKLTIVKEHVKKENKSQFLRICITYLQIEELNHATYGKIKY